MAEPDSSDAALVDTLLEELGASRVGLLAEFVRAYARRVPAVLVAELGTSGLAAHVAHLYSFMSSREPGQLAVRAYNTNLASDGWEAAGSVVEVSVEDAPFLVDTVTTEMHVHGLQVRAVVHPVVGVDRSEDGRIEAITPARGAARRESVMHFQADRRLDDAGLERLRADLVSVLTDLRLAVRDFLPMVERVETMIEAAQQGGSRWSPAVIQESTEFLQWLTDDSFIYLGYREYRISGTGDEATIALVPGTGLGVLSDDARSRFSKPVPVSELDQSVRDRLFSGPLLTVAKTNRETAIHRRARMDYIGVKCFDESGAVVGELRMIGLFTSKAYAESARQIPLIRRKLEAIMRWEDLITGSHDYKAVVELFDSFPKDELFAAPAQELRDDDHGARGDAGGAQRARLPARRPDAADGVGGGRPAPRPRHDRAAGAARAPVRVPLPGRRRRLRPLVRDRPGPVPLHDPRGRRRDPRRLAGRHPARGGGGGTVVG